MASQLSPKKELRSEEKKLSVKVLIAVAIGLGVVIWLFHDEFNAADLSSIHFTTTSILAICAAWLFMAGRDFGLTWRFHVITDKELSWGRSLKVNMLCEFTSAITPSAVGGSAMGMVYMHSEGIEWGRSATLMLTTLFLDELFFTIACPLVALIIPYEDLFGFGASEAFLTGLQTVFWLVYAGIVIWTSILFFGIVLKPRAVRSMLNAIFRWKLLRRWQGNIAELGDNIVATSDDLRHRHFSWWLKVICATLISWCSRFLVINMLFLGFVPDAPQGIVFGRQLIVWVVLMISPTPGGSGISEWLFKSYYGDLISNGALVMVLAVCWRVISYYVYLVIGSFIVPRWLRDNLAKWRKSPSKGTGS